MFGKEALRAVMFGAIAAASLLAGCGGGDDDKPTTIATIAPADAPLYFAADVRPEGEQKEDLDSFLSAVLDTNDPGQKITELIDNEFKSEGEERTFEEDVDPWLGETAGVFVTGTEDDPPALVAVDAKDTDQGLELLRSESTSLTDREYKGVDYQIDEEGDAFGAIEDFVALGDEAAFKAAVDATQGEALADADQFTSATEDVADDALGLAYLDVKQLAGAVAQEEGVPAGIAEDVTSKVGFDDAVVASIDSAPKSLSLDLEGIGDLGGTPPQLLGELPADTTFAVGLDDVGGKVKDLVAAIESAGIPGVGKGTVAAALQAQADLDLESDLLSWLGDAAFFVRGTDPAALDGALVLESKDDTAAALTVDKLRTVVQAQGQGTPKPLELGSGGNGFMLESPDFAQPLNFVQQNGKVVIGYGEASTQAALTPTETLADAKPFMSASGALGDAGPSFFVAIPQAVTLLAADPGANQADFQRLKPYLDRLSYLTAGSSGGALRVILGAE